MRDKKKQDLTVFCLSVTTHVNTSILATHFPWRDLPQTGLKSTAVSNQYSANIIVCSGVMTDASAAPLWKCHQIIVNFSWHDWLLQYKINFEIQRNTHDSHFLFLPSYDALLSPDLLIWLWNARANLHSQSISTHPTEHLQTLNHTHCTGAHVYSQFISQTNKALFFDTAQRFANNSLVSLSRIILLSLLHWEILIGYPQTTKWNEKQTKWNLW